jgi:poly(3-hydroxybutyrate) depolymerase
VTKGVVLGNIDPQRPQATLFFEEDVRWRIDPRRAYVAGLSADAGDGTDRRFTTGYRVKIIKAGASSPGLLPSTGCTRRRATVLIRAAGDWQPPRTKAQRHNHT